MGIKDNLLKALGFAVPAVGVANKVAGLTQSRNQPQANAPEENIPEVEAMAAEDAKPVFRNRDEYQQWLAQQGTGTKVKESANVWWARRKARVAGDLPEEPTEKETPGFFETLRGKQRPEQQPQTPKAPWEDNKPKKTPWAAVAGVAGFLFIVYMLFINPLGSQVIGTGVKTITPGVATTTPLIKAGLTNIWDVVVLQKLPDETFGSEKVKTEEKDVGIKFSSPPEPVRELYISPSPIEIQGRLTAVSPTDNEIGVSVTAIPKPDTISQLGLFSPPPLACYIRGAEGGKIKSSELINRQFDCTSEPKEFCADPLGTEAPGTVKTIPVDVTAKISGTSTKTTKTVYFANPEDIFSVQDPLSKFGVKKEPAGGKQEGDTSIELGVGIVGGADIIQVATVASVTSNYVLGVSVKNPSLSSGTASFSKQDLALYLESIAIIVPDRLNDFDCTVGVPVTTCQLKSDGAMLETGKSKTYYLKIRVLKTALNGPLGSFRARADLTYDYSIPSATTVTLKSLDGSKCCTALNVACPPET